MSKAKEVLAEHLTDLVMLCMVGRYDDVVDLIVNLVEPEAIASVTLMLTMSLLDEEVAGAEHVPHLNTAITSRLEGRLG